MVKPNSKKELVELLSDDIYLVRVHVPPVEGKANKRVIELLAKHFDKPKSSIELLSGEKGKRKIFKIHP